MLGLDRIASRYAELRGRPVIKTDEHLLNRLEAYRELLDDVADMAARKESVKARKAVMGKTKKLQSQLIGECAACGLDLAEYLPRPRQTKETGAARDNVPRLPNAARKKRLADNSGRR